MAPRYSIITINKNNATGLRNTLSSIQIQDSFDYEVIVIDGNSTDNSLSVISEFQPFISIFELEEKPGIYSAMNQAVSHANGEWSLFLNSGDCFFSHSVLSDFNAATDTSLAYGRAWIVGAKGPALYNGLENIWKGQPFCHQALFTKTTVLKSMPFDEGLKIVSDYKFIVQAYLSGYKFEDVDLDICRIEPPGLSGKYVFNRLKEKYNVAKVHWPNKPTLKVTWLQYFKHLSQKIKMCVRALINPCK